LVCIRRSPLQNQLLYGRFFPVIFQENNTEQFAFSHNLTLSMELLLSLQNGSQLVGKLGSLNHTIAITGSEIGLLDQRRLDSVVNFFVMFAVRPQLISKLSSGFQLPTSLGAASALGVSLAYDSLSVQPDWLYLNAQFQQVS
jgi:hypothetical protein